MGGGGWGGRGRAPSQFSRDEPPGFGEEGFVCLTSGKEVGMRSITKILFVAVALQALALAARAQQVTLPLEKYEELRARANPGAGAKANPPAPYALELAEYAVKVGPESARVAQT